MSKNVKFAPFAKLVYFKKVPFRKAVYILTGHFIVFDKGEILSFGELVHRSDNKIHAAVGDDFLCNVEIVRSLSHFNAAYQVKSAGVFFFKTCYSGNRVLKICSEIVVAVCIFVWVMILRIPTVTFTVIGNCISRKSE